jgi:hypothetical protein
LFREFAAARRRRTYEAGRDVTVAWHAVRLWLEVNNKKRLPSLESQLPKVDGSAPRPQSSSQLRSALVVLSEQYGIPLRTR